MAHSIIKKLYAYNSKGATKTVLLATAMCMSLSACDNNNSGITHINSAFNKTWEEIAGSQRKMEDETSHMASQTPLTPDDTSMMAQAGTPDVESETIDIIPKDVRPVPVAPQSPQTVSPYTATLADNRAPRQNLNPKNMFGSDLASDQERLNRLERAVQDMRNDFGRVEPSIRRLMALETDIQSLIRELEKLNRDPSLAPAKVATRSDNLSNDIVNQGNIIAEDKGIPTVVRATPSGSKGFVKKSAPALAGQPVIYDIRVGEHSEKTRIVMDVNNKTSFNVDIDNNEKIMIIDLPNAGWDTKTAQNFAKSPNIKSFKVEASGNGQLAIFQLKRNARIAYQGDLKGFEGTSRRLVIDVSAL